MKPALTPEEWDFVRSDKYEGWMLTGYEDHGAAAICLHGQPFGFTWEDVMLLREVALGFPDTYPIDDIADRIEALLPPSDA